MKNTNRSDIQESFLQLVRLGIGTGLVNGSRLTVNGSDYWVQLKSLADEQGLSAVLLDGVDKLPADNRPPQVLLLEWIGEELQNYEYRYQSYCSTLAELSSLYNTNGIKMMVIKGYACGIQWPRPEHRPYGDIDIYLYGKHKEADTLIRKSGIEIEGGLHHHTIFTFKGEMVEDHFDFINVHGSGENKEVEEIFKKLALDDSFKTTVKGQTIYLPSPNLHALFLLKHAKGHFTSTSLNLRQLLDWGFFVKGYTGLIDWNWLLPLLNKYHLREFFNCINAICVENLGFESKDFPNIQFNPQLKDRMLGDIFEPEFSEDEPKLLIMRVAFKYRRWKANAWKRRMCGENNEIYMFVRSTWKHLLKPKSI